MTIRAANPGDAATLAALYRAARHTAMPSLPDLHSPADDENHFLSVLRGPQEVLIAMQDGAPIGFIVFGHGKVDHLYIHPDHWRTGTGTALLARAQANAKRLELWTFQHNNAARRFYAKCAFVEVAMTDGSNNDEKTPDVRLVWKFWA